MTASLDDLSSNGKLMIQQLGAIVTALNGIFKNTGSFTWSTTTSTFTVNNSGIAANSQILLIPNNASAGTMLGSAKSPYVSSRAVGTSFTLTTAAGTNALGTEIFSYVVITPI